jgi:hypothetical protein
MVEAQRVDADPADAAPLEQPLHGLLAEPGEAHRAVASTLP